MSKTIAIRVSDEVHSALTAQCLATKQNMTELVLPHILGLIELPAAAASPIEVRMMALETQMLEVAARLDVIEAIDLKPVEIMSAPEQIEVILSPVSSRDSSEVGISTSEFAQYIEPILKAYSSGGYYFRFEDLEQPGLKGSIQKQAKQLGFSSTATKIAGKATRVWLNKAYCKQPVNNL